MDFGADDELDYEEDVTESDSLKNTSESLNCMGNGVSMNTNFTSYEEDYLQINCSEEEESFVSGDQTGETVASEEARNNISERPSKTVNSEITAEEAVEAQKAQKADERSGKAKARTVSKRKNVRTLTNRLNDFSHNNCNANKKKIKKKKRTWSFPRRSAIRKKLTNSLTLNPWLPEYDFLEAGDMMRHSGVALCNDQLLLSHRNCPTSRKPTVPLPAFGAFQQEQNLQRGQQLTADDKRFVGSNSPIGIAVNGRNLTQQWFKPLMSDSESSTAFKEDISEFKTVDQGMNPSKNLGCNNNMKYNVSSKIEKFKNASLFQKNVDVTLRQKQEDLGENCRVDEPEENCRNAFKSSHVRNAGCIPLNKCGWKYEAESTISFLSERKKCAIKINALKDDEKELVRLKKEARRKRFMQDVIIKNEQEPFESNVAKKSDDRLLNDFSKKGEPKLLEEKFQPRESEDSKSDHNSLLEKTNLKKELLLKKRNPFDGSVEMTTCIAGTKIKQEVMWNEGLKAEYAESTFLKEAKVEKQPVESGETKVLGDLHSNDPGLFIVKNEEASQVKFFRTISRSLDELGFGKPKTGAMSERTFAPKALPIVKEDMQEQVTRQLTGCIVKVLNIPPSTTTNDILSLCSGIGIVREVKLNFPKENSVVIRFAEPSSAENFFSLYHGQKMNNYFLNVIII